MRLLNKRGAFEKEGQRFTCKIFLVDEVGLNSVRVQGKENKFNFIEVLKVSSLSQEIDNSLRKKQLSLFKADKRNANVKVLNLIEVVENVQDNNRLI